MAVAIGYRECALILVERGADVTLKNKVKKKKKEKKEKKKRKKVISRC